MSYAVRFTKGAKADLDALYDFLLEKDVDTASAALDAVEQAVEVLRTFPLSCRKAADGAYGPFLRELVIPFGARGYVVLFELSGAHEVTVLAARHQRESDSR